MALFGKITKKTRPERPFWRLALALSLLSLFGCGNATTAGQPEYRAPASDAIAAPVQSAQPDPRSGESFAPVWNGLAQRLAKDGVSGPRVDALLASLGSAPTQSPMGRKISELYQKRFFPKPKSAKPRQQYYKGVVTPANAALCREFIAEHRAAFEEADRRYGVPPSIAAALLFVETRLGRVLGDVPENALYTLASMAISTQPEDISQWLPKLRDSKEHLDWIEETMRKRADWAYNETLALLKHMIRDNIPPERLPGSIYGAVGLCQFMPSNISAYGADGDGDNRVDLFSAPDAIASLANYLAKHGWKRGISREKQHKLLMTYNHSTTYANTIMALADLVSKNDPAAKPRKPGTGSLACASGL